MSLPRPDFGGGLPDLVRGVIEQLGEDVEREGLLDTPERAASTLRHLTDGYGQDPAEIVGEAVFAEEYDETVVLRDIPFYSLCEHHLLPFFGTCTVAYQPAGRVVGLSKIPRLVDVFAHRLQLQERLTREVAQALDGVVGPRGVGVYMEARHLCMEMRGVERPAQTITTCLLGSLQTDARARSEFIELVRRSG